MRHLLILSALSLSLSSCYIEVTDNHDHGNAYEEPYETYPVDNQFESLNIQSNMQYNEAVRLSGYALQLYSLSNQPHQLAFLSESNNLLNDTVLAQNLIEGDMLGITQNDINNRLLANTCDYGYLDITDYKNRSFDNYYLDGNLYDEFDADFTLHTSPNCEFRNTHSNLLNPTIELEGALNYDVFFKNYITNNNESLTDELSASISGNWSVENDSIGFWDITNFSSQSNYQRFEDNIVWTQLSSELTVHDHSRESNGHFNISSDTEIQTQLGIIHPYAGRIVIEDQSTHNKMQIQFYADSIDIYVNEQLIYDFIDWDEVISMQSYFGIL